MQVHRLKVNSELIIITATNQMKSYRKEVLHLSLSSSLPVFFLGFPGPGLFEKMYII